MISVLFAAIATILSIFGTYIDLYVGREVYEYVISLVFISVAVAFVSALLQGLQLVHLSGALTPIRVSSRSLFQVALVALGLGLSGLLVGYIMGGLAALAVGSYFVHKRIDMSIPSVDHFRRLAEFAKYAWIERVGSRGFNWIDITILGLFVPSNLVGIYSIAWNISTFLALFGNSIQITVFPEISNLFENGQEKAAKDLFNDSLKYSGLLAIPGFVGGLLIGEEILAIFGQEFRAGHSVLVLLIGTYLVFSYQRQFKSLLDAVDRPDITFRIVAIFLGLNVLLNLILIVEFGLVGAAVATFMSTLLSGIHAYVEAIRLVEFEFPLLITVKQCFSAGVMGIILFVIQTTLHLPSFSFPEIRTLVLVAFGAALYFGVLIMVSGDFRRTVVENLFDHI